MNKKYSDLNSILDNTVKTQSGCMEWQGARIPHGYGSIRWNGTAKNVTNVVLMLMGETIKSGQVVCHKCDNPSCINPEHLFIGTQKENILDSQNKGRSLRARHGTLTMYSLYKCRCALCKIAKAVENSKRSRHV